MGLVGQIIGKKDSITLWEGGQITGKKDILTGQQAYLDRPGAGTKVSIVLQPIEAFDVERSTIYN